MLDEGAAAPPLCGLARQMRGAGPQAATMR
jgi:hypothetical protein